MCDYNDFEDGCLELERELTCGGRIGWQDMKWHVFRKCGCSVNEGANTMQELILSLVPSIKDKLTDAK